MAPAADPRTGGSDGRRPSLPARIGHWLLPPLPGAPDEPEPTTLAGKLSYAWRHYLWTAAESPARRAAAVGLGIFCSIFPVWGAQMLLALVLARLLGLNRALTLAASNFSLPPVIPFIVYAALLIGRGLLSGAWRWVYVPEAMTLEAARASLGEFLLGSGVLAAAAGLAAWAVSWILLAVFRPRRPAP